MAAQKRTDGKNGVIRFWVGAVLLLLVCGCRAPMEENVPAVGTDAALLNAPFGASLSPQPASFALPTTPGTRWESIGDNKARLETVVVGPQQVGGDWGTRYDTRVDGKPFQSEVYEVRPDGAVYGLATGPTASVRIVPPLPVLEPGALSGGVHFSRWRGTLVSGTKRQNAEAACRVVGRNRLRTPAGLFSALRVDLVVTLSPETAPSTRRATLWIVPGLGIVQQSYPGKKASLNVVWTLARVTHDAPATGHAGSAAEVVR